MSKSNRRRQGPGSQPSAARPSDPTSRSAVPPEDGAPDGPGGTADSDPGGATPGTATPTTESSRTPATGSGATRSASGSRAPSGAIRQGRRDRQRTAHKPSLLERYRTALIALAALAGVVLISVFVFASASAPAYACSTTWDPAPTASPAAAATPALGFIQPEIGSSHINRGANATYAYCPPASGPHYNAQGIGPIAPRVYGPDDAAIPQGWVHNLEHGSLVILYQGTSDGVTPDGQAALKAYYQDFPTIAGCGPVVARFDEMATPYAALVWDRVLQLDSFDAAQITAFWNQWGGRTNPEKLCPGPDVTPSPAPSGSAAPSPS